MKELPEYQCHKKVRAAQIGGISDAPSLGGGVTLHIKMPAEKFTLDNGRIVSAARISTYEVSPEYMSKHNPQVGGYFVEYEDGYQSYSPKEAFEAGYTLVGEAE